MRYKTLFRLALRIMGIWCILVGLHDLIDDAIWYAAPGASYFGGGPPTSPPSREWRFSPPVTFGWLFYVLAGAHLLFGGRVLTNFVIPSNRRYCHECGYELRSTSKAECPECGVAIEGT